jgi:hypothetical protein
LLTSLLYHIGAELSLFSYLWVITTSVPVAFAPLSLDHTGSTFLVLTDSGVTGDNLP